MTAIIQIQDLVQNYGGKAPVLDHIRLDIGRGEFVALVGQNGAGKSTLVKHFNGLLRPDSGRVLVCGRDTQRVTTACLAQQVGYVFQNPDHQIFLERVDKEVAFGPGNLGLNAAEVECRTVKALEQTGLTRFRE
ncbi:MAG TPA: ABC transporter ATP-binding protein, partial [Bacillota bacterium]